MKIVIIDGQGGGLGRSLVEEISKRLPKAELIVIGTNAAATANMLKGATEKTNIIGATGENPVIFNSRFADIIVGPIGIVMANAIVGEITPKMAEAVSSSQAKIILIPMNRCRAVVVGVESKKFAEYITEAVDLVCEEEKICSL